jgi:hypothetical protein
MSETQDKPAFPRVIAGGDHLGGWLIDIHDGVNQGVYSPVTADVDSATAAAWSEHNARFGLTPAAVTPVAPAAEAAPAAAPEPETVAEPAPAAEPAPI